jgi:hypothetical protein
MALLVMRNYRFHVHPRGFTLQDQPVTFGGEQIGVEMQNFEPTEVARLADIKSFCEKHGILIEFITPVLPDLRLTWLDREVLFAQRRAFVHALGQYFELTRIAGISDRPEMFRDSSHLNRDGMRALFSRYPWSDRVATAETIDKFLSEMSAAARR